MHTKNVSRRVSKQASKRASKLVYSGRGVGTWGRERIVGIRYAWYCIVGGKTGRDRGGLTSDTRMTLNKVDIIPVQFAGPRSWMILAAASRCGQMLVVVVPA